MHEDYQLAYCPIAHIAALAFADNAFENPRLTPKLLHKLRMPKRLHVLPLQFKKSMHNIPIFRLSGLHPALLPILHSLDHTIRPVMISKG